MPMHEPPSDVDVAACQKTINEIFGTTADRGHGTEIIKLVWSGDRRFWEGFFMEWYGNGKPCADLVLRPRYRYGQISDTNGKLIRDIFPPRWLLLARLEPEQYEATWWRESYFWDPGISARKQIRVDEPPPVFWLNHSIIAEHRNGCCARRRKCFGEYASPQKMFEVLRQEKLAIDKEGARRPYEKVDADSITAVNDIANGYRHELRNLQAEAQVMVENPLALIGLAGMIAKDPTHAAARQRVEDFYKRKEDELADKAAKAKSA
jgi:hypothetical protein